MSGISKSSPAARAAMHHKVAQRQEWFVPKQERQALLARGFRGWHAGENLPHFDAPNTHQFITMRLADTLPRPALDLARSQTSDLAQVRWIDQQLDAGSGACWLHRPAVAELTQDAILWFHGSRYDVLAWVIMPNHIHCLIKIGTDFPMAKIVRTWKSVTAHRINRILDRKGAVWQTEVWDHYLRSSEELGRFIDYIEANPVSAHLTKTSNPKEWPWSSARWRREDGSLDLNAARSPGVRVGPTQA